MNCEFENTLAVFIREKNLFDSGQPVLLAVSGGADSTALLYALCSLRDKKILENYFSCAHINHSLRGPDSNRDESFVVEQSRRLNVPVITKKLNVVEFAEKNKLSIETAARSLRIKALLEIAEDTKSSIVATAHQSDDNAETIVHNMVRGTGFRGLAGIRPKRNFQNTVFVSPLLCFSRQQIIDYLNDRSLSFCMDKTNFDCTYRRNFIRHLLLPKLQQQSTGSIVELLSSLSEKANRVCLAVDNYANQIWPQAIDSQKDALRLKIEIFSGQHPEVKIELIRKILDFLGCGQRDLTFDHYTKILALADKKVANKTVVLPGGFAVKKEYDNLLFFKGLQKAGIETTTYDNIEIIVPGQAIFGDYKIQADVFEIDKSLMIENFRINKEKIVERFDLEKIVLPLRIRRRFKGDRFCPLGQHCDKKINRFLIDQKVPPSQRQKTLVIEDSEKIVWLWPLRINDKVKITGKTRKILQLKITDSC
jgi:tRNA(Ile)-lysidine synthase